MADGPARRRQWFAGKGPGDRLFVQEVASGLGKLVLAERAKHHAHDNAHHREEPSEG